MTDFHGYPVWRLSSKFLQLDCLASAGPRIVRLSYRASDNLLAEMADESIATPYGDYHYMGGHRLWHAPEAMPRTYVPDGEGLTAMELADGLVLNGRTEPGTGIRKRLEVRVDPDTPRVTLTHGLTNEGLWDVKLAPWAITMLRLGGTAILPTRLDGSTEGLLPNRHIALWPYSHVDDTRLSIEDDCIVIRATSSMPAFKIGTFNPGGWTAYWNNNVLFRKSYPVHAELEHPDFGCNAEIYCDSHFIELESIGPLVKLEPGAAVEHVEIWEFFDTLQQEFISEKMIGIIQSL